MYLGPNDAHDRDACLLGVANLFAQPFCTRIDLHADAGGEESLLNLMGMLHGLCVCVKRGRCVFLGVCVYVCVCDVCNVWQRCVYVNVFVCVCVCVCILMCLYVLVHV